MQLTVDTCVPYDVNKRTYSDTCVFLKNKCYNFVSTIISLVLGSKNSFFLIDTFSDCK